MAIRTLVAAAALVALASPALAADLLRVQPVTDSVIVLQFREGHIKYNGVRPDGSYAPQTENTIYYSPLDLDKATRAQSYRITSEDHAAYSGGAVPTHVGYKAKGHDFHGPHHTPQFLREYLVYAQLPEPLQSGRTYTVHVGELAGNVNSRSFTFDEKKVRSPAVHVSHVGYRPEAPKFAYFSQWMGTFNSDQHPEGALNLQRYTDGAFHVLDAETRQIRRTYRGIQLQKDRREPDLANPNMAGADVYSLDFSDFREPGRYVIAAEGMGSSWPFEIGEHVYEDAHRATMRSVFLQRRGIYKQLPEFDREYPRSHHPDTNRFVYGRVEGEGARIDDPRPVENIWGWYADAGDWDGYPSHYVVPYILMLTYDIRPEHFRDGDYNNTWRERADQPWINEGESGLPDILDEARWLVDFYRRARHELVRQGLGTGGVPGYVGRDAGAHYQPAWNDDRELYISEERVGMAFAYAGAAAYYAHCLNKASGNGHPGSADWLKDAIDAYNWAQGRNEDGDDVLRMRQLASVCLYLATGEPQYQQAFRQDWQADGQRNAGAWIGHTANMIASAIYLLSAGDQPQYDREFAAEVRASMIRRADDITDNNQQVGFRLGGLENHQNNGMNLITVPRAFFQIVAYELTGEQKYIDSVHNTLSFVLGGNQEGYSRLTGIGHQGEQDAFVCDAWYLLDLNHIVYRNPIFPGYSAYGLYAGWDVGGPGSEQWARSSTLPEIGQWPVGEQRMRNRYSIAGSEWTIHQNQPWYILATGYLLPQNDRPVERFSRPTVRLAMQQDQVDLSRPMELRAEASEQTERVEYYYAWRFIGESTDRDSGFALIWNPGESQISGDEVQITAVAYDRRGQISLPGPEGERVVPVTGRRAR